jgi:hypothetical protein
MNGSRHEKAAITAVSYVIGFTAAYILFGNFTSTSTPAIFIKDSGNAAAVITAAPAEEEVVQEVAPAEPAFEVTYQEGKLEVTNNDEVKLLSHNPEITKFGSIDSTSQGTHSGDLAFTVSKDNKFVFFCEQGDIEADICAGYVYDVDEDKIYPVTKSGTAAKISISSAKDAIFTAVGLKIGSNYSANPKAPWVMISGEDALDLQ